MEIKSLQCSSEVEISVLLATLVRLLDLLRKSGPSVGARLVAHVLQGVGQLLRLFLLLADGGHADTISLLLQNLGCIDMMMIGKKRKNNSCL